MSLPVYAVWFPEKQTVIISGGDSGAPDFFNEWEVVDRLGPSASSERRRYWRLPKGRAVGVPVNIGSRYELFGTGDKSSTPFVLDIEVFQDTTLIFVLYATANGATQSRFIVSDGSWTDALQLYDYLQEVLDPRVRSEIHGTWYSPIFFTDKEMRVGPARTIALPRERRTIEIPPPTSAASAMSKIKLFGSTIRLVASGDSGHPVLGALPTEPPAILLVWRSMFAERFRQQDQIRSSKHFTTM